ncbi:MAG: four helix bundle protein [Candidatus Limisoma sp.]
MDKIYFSFEKLNVWQESRNLVKEIYIAIREFPSEEKYSLCDQIRRAVVSVPSNIAEGAGRMSIKEKSHFIEIAYGSLMELYCQIQIAHDLDYISESQLSSIKNRILRISKMLNALQKSFK